jgi:cathepsin X
MSKANFSRLAVQRNSWGEYWGEMGYARVGRGRNQLSIEQACAWGKCAHCTFPPPFLLLR